MKKAIRIVLSIRDGVVSLVEGESAVMVMEWYRCNGPAAYERVEYRELPVRYPGQLSAAESWYGCKIQRPFRR